MCKKRGKPGKPCVVSGLEHKAAVESSAETLPVEPVSETESHNLLFSRKLSFFSIWCTCFILQIICLLQCI